MNDQWSLDILYKGYDDPAFLEDLARQDKLIEESHKLVAALPNMTEEEGLTAIINWKETFNNLAGKLMSYISLRQSADTTDQKTAALMGQLMEKHAQLAKDEAAISRYIADCKQLDELTSSNDLLKEYSFFLHQIRKEAGHLLSNDVEDMISKMNLTGGNGWSDLFNYATSTVDVDYEGDTVTLSYIRSLAHDPDPKVRKSAYEAEQAAYKKIDVPVAFALNNIKKQVQMLSSEHGYDSPLALTLEQSWMSQETLDALLTAIEEYLPKFESYMLRKAKLLGYENGLPWYELFAPIGSFTRRFTVEEAKDCLIECFSSFSKQMSDMMETAFDQAWIDFYPRAGKVGGAFCAALPMVKQSRILTNFNGSISDVDTLAHELGHAFHDLQVENERPLNQNYTMPVAETASTFNENVFMNYAIDHAEGEAKLALIESQLQDANQTICDIYSRFLFERSVFEESKDQFLFPDQLREIMNKSQEKAYGKGLDPEVRHSNMWVNKPHYYSADLSYYNFPYSFGALFAKGLYALYKKEGASFVPKYQEMLKATTHNTVEDTARVMGIDLTKPDFWRGSLDLIAESIDTFLQLTE